MMIFLDQATCLYRNRTALIFRDTSKGKSIISNKIRGVILGKFVYGGAACNVGFNVFIFASMQLSTSLIFFFCKCKLNFLFLFFNLT